MVYPEVDVQTGAWAGTEADQRRECAIKLACDLYNQRCPSEEATRIVAELVDNEAITRAIVETVYSTARRRSGFDPDYDTSHLFTDMGNAERLVYCFGRDLRFCHAWGQWLVWDGRRWQVDPTGQVEQWAKFTVRLIYVEASLEPHRKLRDNLVVHAKQSESREKIRNMIDLAKSDLPVTPEQLDNDPYLLNVLNGTIDLRTGEFRPHRHEDLITKCAPVPYDPEATCPRWLEFLNEITGSDPDLVAYLQQIVGYTLSGDTSHHCLFLLYGPGANGKTTFLETIRALLGDYAQQAEFSTFLKSDSDRIRNDIAALEGARFVSASEVNDGRYLDESLVKQLTGGDTIRARRLYHESYEYRPQFKLFLAANHKPNIRGTDEGIWRRIMLVPFEVVIPADQRDPHLPKKLKEELPGILNWALDGWKKLQQAGKLVEPDVVRQANRAYRSEMDVLGDFLEECCDLDPDVTVPKAALYSRYRVWCQNNGRHALNSKNFAKQLIERGIAEGRTSKERVWRGLRLEERTVPLTATKAA